MRVNNEVRIIDKHLLLTSRIAEEKMNKTEKMYSPTALDEHQEELNTNTINVFTFTLFLSDVYTKALIKNEQNIALFIKSPLRLS